MVALITQRNSIGNINTKYAGRAAITLFVPARECKCRQIETFLFTICPVVHYVNCEGRLAGRKKNKCLHVAIIYQTPAKKSTKLQIHKQTVHKQNATLRHVLYECSRELSQLLAIGGFKNLQLRAVYLLLLTVNLRYQSTSWPIQNWKQLELNVLRSFKASMETNRARPDPWTW